MRQAEAWVLYPGNSSKSGSTKLVRETVRLQPLSKDEVYARPLYGCWEGNMGHALLQRPIDICVERKEEKVVIGNAAVVRVLEVGPGVANVRPGDHAILFCSGVEDAWGYPRLILGYDAAGMAGCLAKEMVFRARQLIRIPENTRYSLAQWAAFSLRYITAWSNWELAYGVFRLQVAQSECPTPHVWGWGGGVSFAELDLARRQDCQAVMLCSHRERLRELAHPAIGLVDRLAFGDLEFDEARYRSDADYRERYQRSEQAFLEEVARRTRGEMVQVFVDCLGAPIFRATVKALSREGVVTTAGWKLGMEMRYRRASACINRHQYIHTHYAKYEQGLRAVAYAEDNGWLPPVRSPAYGFDDVAKLAEDYEHGLPDYFPCYAINPE